MVATVGHTPPPRAGQVCGPDRLAALVTSVDTDASTLHAWTFSTVSKLVPASAWAANALLWLAYLYSMLTMVLPDVIVTLTRFDQSVTSG